jgi:hypothetical protein
MSVTYIPTALRNLVYERAKGFCQYCKISEELRFAKYQIDYIIAGTTAVYRLKLI